MLYKVDVETTLYVIAENELQAEQIAYDNLHEEARNSTYITDIIDDIKYVERVWRDCIPYGGDKDLNCEEYLESLKPKVEEIVPAKTSVQLQYEIKFGGDGVCSHCHKEVSNKSYHEARCGTCKI